MDYDIFKDDDGINKYYLTDNHDAFILIDRGYIEFVDDKGVRQMRDYRHCLNEMWYLLLVYLIKHNGRPHTDTEIYSVVLRTANHRLTEDNYPGCILDYCKNIRSGKKNRTGVIEPDFYRYVKDKGFELKQGTLDSGSKTYMIKLPVQTPESLVRVSAQEIIACEQRSFIIPRDWMEQLKKRVFVDPFKVHVISGERGIGKSLFARYFASECAKGNVRKDLCFKHLVYTAYSERGLEDTISLLPTTNKITDDPFDAKIKLMKEMSKPALLIIDNYDAQENIKAELAENGEVYRLLRETGWNILITSRRDLRDAFALDQTVLTKLPIDKLVWMYYDISEMDDDDEGRVRYLIDNILARNTYLVALTAKLARKRNLENIISAFEENRAANLVEPLVGRDSGERTLYEHFRTLYDYSEINGDNDKVRIMYNLALLPLDGLEYDDVFEYAFPGPDSKAIRFAYSSLADSYWVLESNRFISLHPLVREMILSQREGYSFELIREQVKAVFERLLYRAYDSTMPYMLKRGIAVFNALSELDPDNPYCAYYASRICSNYDIIGYDEMIAQYGKIAYDLLGKIEFDPHESESAFLLAESYNKIGYSLLHCKTALNCRKLAETCINRASELIMAVEKKDIKLKRLYTTHRGDLAAMYLAQREYEKAYDIHKENVRYREAMRDELTESDYCVLMAASYKGMGTAEYYLARVADTEAHKISYLRGSFNDHAQAVSYYEQVYGSDHLDTSIAVIRRAGAFCQLFGYLSAEERLKYGYDMIAGLLNSYKFICSMEEVNNRELANCEKTAMSIYSLMKENDLLNDRFMGIVEEMTDLGALEIDNEKNIGTGKNMLS